MAFGKKKQPVYNNSIRFVTQNRSINDSIATNINDSIATQKQNNFLTKIRLEESDVIQDLVIHAFIVKFMFGNR